MKCRFPGCQKESERTWALVPLCKKHCETIKTETLDFYSKTRSLSEIERRPHYMQIAYLIPWSKENLGKLEEV